MLISLLYLYIEQDRKHRILSATVVSPLTARRDARLIINGRGEIMIIRLQLLWGFKRGCVSVLVLCKQAPLTPFADAWRKVEGTDPCAGTKVEWAIIWGRRSAAARFLSAESNTLHRISGPRSRKGSDFPHWIAWRLNSKYMHSTRYNRHDDAWNPLTVSKDAKSKETEKHASAIVTGCKWRYIVVKSKSIVGQTNHLIVRLQGPKNKILKILNNQTF